MFACRVFFLFAIRACVVFYIFFACGGKFLKVICGGVAFVGNGSVFRIII
jgi:hypothetical protein